MAEHDGGYKLLFSHPRTVEELLRGFVHEGWVERLDFSTLERVGASFVSHDLRAVSAISDRIACLNLTLHYHDVPEHIPPDLVYQMFACDLEAFGLGDTCDKPGHLHPHIAPAEPKSEVTS